MNMTFQKMLDHYKALMNAEMAAEKVVAKSQTFLPVSYGITEHLMEIVTPRLWRDFAWCPHS